MKIHSHLRATVALAIVGALTLAACGGSDSSPSGSNRNRNAALTDLSASIDDQISDMATGCTNNVVLTASGEVVSWGSFGRATTKTARLITSSCWNAAAITEEGTLKLWGIESPIAIATPPEDVDFSSVTQIAITFWAGLVIDNAGMLHQWGSANSIPENLKTLTFKEIRANAFSFIAIDSNNRIHGWTPGSNAPIVPDRMKNVEVKEVVGGLYNFTVLDTDGRIYGWNSSDVNSDTIPKKISAGTYKIISNSLRDFFSIAVDTAGVMVIWGIDPFKGNAVAEIPTWVWNEPDESDQIVRVKIGLIGVYVQRESGWIESWSSNPNDNVDIPFRLNSRQYVSPVAAGGFHTYAIDDTFAIRQLDDSKQTTVLPEGNDFIALAAGLNHGLAIRQDGTLAGWYDSAHPESSVAAQIPDGLKDVTKIAAGYNWSIAVSNNSELHQWGTIFSPTQDVVSAPTGQLSYLRLKATYNHAVALVDNWDNNSMQVVAWGDNSAGQSTVPSSLADANDIVDVAAGYNCSAALHEDGTITMWGKCSEYQSLLNPPTVEGGWKIELGVDFGIVLGGGDGVTVWGENSFDIANIPDSSSAMHYLAVGRFHAVTSSWDGNVVAWGDNSQNQATVPEDLTFINLNEGYGGPAMSEEEWLAYLAQVEAEQNALNDAPATPVTVPPIKLQDGSTITIPVAPPVTQPAPVAAQSTVRIVKASDPSVVQPGASVSLASVKEIMGIKKASKVTFGKVVAASAKVCSVTSKGIKAKVAGICVVNVKYVLKKKTISAKIKILVTP